MTKLFDWVKTHKIISVLIFVVFILIVNPLEWFSSSRISPIQLSDYSGESPGMKSAGVANSVVNRGYSEAAPTPEITDRKIVLNTNFSLLVKNVVDSVDSIKAKTKEMLGYMVSMNINSSEFGDTANIQVRVPTEKLDDFSKYLRGMAVKVVSENIQGTDITDQYVDIQRRLGDLEKQRTRVETILNSANTVTEMMEVQRQLFLIQDQIDAYKGQLLYMDGTTKTSKLTIYLSTDELSLPYAPAQPWRPEVIFKSAVRSLLTDAEKIGTALIWLVVYTPLVVLAVVVFKLIRRIFRKKVQ